MFHVVCMSVLTLFPPRMTTVCRVDYGRYGCFVGLPTNDNLDKARRCPADIAKKVRRQLTSK